VIPLSREDQSLDESVEWHGDQVLKRKISKHWPYASCGDERPAWVIPPTKKGRPIRIDLVGGGKQSGGK